jgi:hypothetical protein
MIKEVVGVQRLLADISVALYKIAPGVGGLALVNRVTQPMRKAIVPMLESAPDTKTLPDEFAIHNDAGCNVRRDAPERLSARWGSAPAVATRAPSRI